MLRARRFAYAVTANVGFPHSHTGRADSLDIFHRLVNDGTAYLPLNSAVSLADRYEAYEERTALRVVGADSQAELAAALRSGAGSLTLQTALDALAALRSFASTGDGKLRNEAVSEVATFVNGRLVVDAMRDTSSKQATTMHRTSGGRTASSPSRAVSAQQFHLLPRILGLTYELGLQDTPLGSAARRAMRGTLLTASAPVLLVAAAEVVGKPGSVAASFVGDTAARAGIARHGSAVAVERAAFERDLVDAAVAACKRGGVRDTSVLLLRALRRIPRGATRDRASLNAGIAWFEHAVAELQAAVARDCAAMPASRVGLDRRNAAPADREQGRPNVTRHQHGAWRTLQQGLMALGCRCAYGPASGLLLPGPRGSSEAASAAETGGGRGANRTPGIVASLAEPSLAGTTSWGCEAMLAWHEGLGIALAAEIHAPGGASGAGGGARDGGGAGKARARQSQASWQDCLRLGWAVLDEAAWLGARGALEEAERCASGEAAPPLSRFGGERGSTTAPVTRRSGRSELRAAHALIDACPDTSAPGHPNLPRATDAAIGLLCGAGFALGGAGRFLSAGLRPVAGTARLEGTAGPALAAPLDTLPVLMAQVAEGGTGEGRAAPAPAGLSLAQGVGMPSRDAASLLVRCCATAERACRLWLGREGAELPALSSRELCFASRAIATALSTAELETITEEEASGVSGVCEWVVAAIEDEAGDVLASFGVAGQTGTRSSASDSASLGTRSDRGAGQARKQEQQLQGRVQAMQETVANVAVVAGALQRLRHQAVALGLLQACGRATSAVESCAQALDASRSDRSQGVGHGGDLLTRVRVSSIRAALASAEAGTTERIGAAGQTSAELTRATEEVAEAALQAVEMATWLALRHSHSDSLLAAASLPAGDGAEPPHVVPCTRVEPLLAGRAARLLPLAEALARADAAVEAARGARTALGRLLVAGGGSSVARLTAARHVAERMRSRAAGSLGAKGSPGHGQSSSDRARRLASMAVWDHLEARLSLEEGGGDAVSMDAEHLAAVNAMLGQKPATDDWDKPHKPELPVQELSAWIA